MFTIKRQIIFLIFFNSLLTVNAKNKTIFYGTPHTGGAEIHIANNNKYEIVLKYGAYEKVKIREGEYLVFDSPEIQSGWFSVIENEGENKSTDSITIHFLNRTMNMYSKDVFIGYKINDEDTFTYLNLNFENRLFNTNPEDEGFHIKIPYTDELELIYRKSNLNKFYIERFKLSSNTANVYCDYKYSYRGRGYNVFATIDPAGKLTVNDRLFSTKNPPGDHVERISSDSVQNWDMPFLVEKETYKKFDNPRLSYQPILTISPRDYKLEFPRVESLEEAISMVKNDDSKILLIFNQLLDNNAEYYFEEIAEAIYRKASYDYLSDYHFDKYLLYFSKPEDRAALKAYKSEGVNEVIALNSGLDVLYTECINTERFSRKYGSGLSKELSNNLLTINAIANINRKVKYGILNSKDFLELGKWRDNEYMIKCLDIKLNDYGDFEVESSVDEGSSSKSEDDKLALFYSQEIASARLKEGLSKLIQKHKNDESIDIDFAKLAMDFLVAESFFGLSIGKKSAERTKEDYEFCLYLSKFPVETSHIRTDRTYYIEDHVFQVLETLKGPESKQYPELVIPTYENLIKLESYDLYFIFYYYNYLIGQGKQPYESFDTLFKKIVSKPNNYLEQLEIYYDTYAINFLQMDELKYYVSVVCNLMAWEAVSKQKTDKVLLGRALEWSKTSVAIEPENHYFLDTYAYLQYFTGNKEKAIQTESKAMLIAKKDGENKYVIYYKKTMGQMKDGTLK